jgi:hypothetical protein
LTHFSLGKHVQIKVVAYCLHGASLRPFVVVSCPQFDKVTLYLTARFCARSMYLRAPHLAKYFLR